MTITAESSTEISGRPMAVSCLVRNAAPTWKRLLRQGQQQVLVFSPYLTGITTLRETRRSVPLFVYTEFVLEMFASGASSLRTLKEIKSWDNTEVLWLPGLHAKIVVVDGQLMTLGSQNMTVRGEKNLEATALVSDPGPIAESLDTVEKWREQALPITDAMIAEIEFLLPPVAKMYRQYSRLCNAGQERIRELADDEVATKMRALEEEAALERQRQKEAHHLMRERKRRLKELKLKETALLAAINKSIAHVCRRIKAFFPQDNITEEIARDFIRESAWWLKHRSGPRRAPKARWHVYRSPWLGYCWSYSRNSNKFMVERAVIRCKEWLTYFLKDERWNGQDTTTETLVQYMISSVVGCVANCNDEPYQGEYRTQQNDILFGVHSIDAKDFVECFLFRYADAQKLISALKELEIVREEINNNS